jgi:hypothetical protein
VVIPPPPPAIAVGGVTVTGIQWARILTPTSTYSTTDDLLWTAQIDELYWVMRYEGGWILGVWENDTNFWAVWFNQNDALILLLDKEPTPPSTQVYLMIFRQIERYSTAMEPAGMAMPGESYPLLREQDGWALVAVLGEPNLIYWIEIGPEDEFATSDPLRQ